MGVSRLGFLVLVLFHSISVYGFQLNDCGTHWTLYLRSSLGFEVNGKAALDTVQFCRNLKAYNENGCFCDSELEEWKRVGRKYCGLELSVPKSVKCIHSSGKMLHVWLFYFILTSVSLVVSTNR